MASSSSKSHSRSHEHHRSDNDNSSRTHKSSSGRSDHKRSHRHHDDDGHHHHRHHHRHHRHHRESDKEPLSSEGIHDKEKQRNRNLDDGIISKDEGDEFPGYTVIEAPDFTDDETDIQENILQKRFKEGDFELKVGEHFANFDGGYENTDHETRDDRNQNRFEKDTIDTTMNVSKEEMKGTDAAPTKKSVLDVNYTFGDRGSSWRMLKLNKCFEISKEEGISVEQVAARRFGSPLLFYIAVEEKEELDRRKKYNIPESEWILKPTGSIAKSKGFAIDEEEITKSNGTSSSVLERSNAEPLIEVSQVNEAKINMMRAKLQNKGNYANLLEVYQNLQKQYEEQQQSDKKNLSVYKDRSVAVDDMTIAEMIQEEKLTSSKDSLKQQAKAITVDTKFDEDLEAQDENASKLAKLSKSGKINIKDLAEMSNNSSSMKRYTKALENCSFCLDNGKPLPIVSMASTCYLTLAAQPELTKYGCIIAPMDHKRNTLSLSIDENEEIRNYMKTLTRFYEQELQMRVLFYESSIYETNHACIKSVPIPMDFQDSEIKGFFKQGILELINVDQSNHVPIIDTLEKSETAGRSAISSLISKEAPYFHVWLDINGGIGHIVEDLQSWPKGDRFARGIICGMLDLDPLIEREQTKLPFNNEELLNKFKKLYRKYDWVQ